MGLLQGPTGGGVLMREVPLYPPRIMVELEESVAAPRDHGRPCQKTPAATPPQYLQPSAALSMSPPCARARCRLLLLEVFFGVREREEDPLFLDALHGLPPPS